MKTLWKSFCLLVTALVLATPQALAVPCKDRQIPLTELGVSVFADCDDDSILYFVPEKLTLSERSFDGGRSFQWNEQNGEARVTMEMRLFHSDAAILRALRDIKSRFPKRYRLLPFEVKDVSLQGFGGEEDGVLEQHFTTTAGFSNSRFRIFLRLNQEGIQLWRKARAQGDFVIQASTLHYKMRFRQNGQDDWLDETTTLNLESVPECILTGGNTCSERDRTAALLERGAQFGALYFHMQFVQCSDFVSSVSFNRPIEAEVREDYLSPSDVLIVYNAATRAFDDAKEQQRRDCAAPLEEADGYSWMLGYGRLHGIDCNTGGQWPWSRILAEAQLQGGSPHFLRGVERAYRELLVGGGCARSEVCDFLGSTGVDARCSARLETPSRLCFSAAALREFVTITQGYCEFRGYRWTTEYNPDGEFMENWVNVPQKSPAEALAGDTCISLKTEVSMSDVMGRVICRGHN